MGSSIVIQAIILNWYSKWEASLLPMCSCPLTLHLYTIKLPCFLIYNNTIGVYAAFQSRTQDWFKIIEMQKVNCKMKDTSHSRWHRHCISCVTWHSSCISCGKNSEKGPNKSPLQTDSKILEHWLSEKWLLNSLIHVSCLRRDRLQTFQLISVNSFPSEFTSAKWTNWYIGLGLTGKIDQHPAVASGYPKASGGKGWVLWLH